MPVEKGSSWDDQKRPYLVKTCPECAKDFTARSPVVLYCSILCGYRTRQRRSYAKRHPEGVRTYRRYTAT